MWSDYVDEAEEVLHSGIFMFLSPPCDGGEITQLNDTIRFINLLLRSERDKILNPVENTIIYL